MKHDQTQVSSCYSGHYHIALMSGDSKCTCTTAKYTKCTRCAPDAFMRKGESLTTSTSCGLSDKSVDQQLSRIICFDASA